MRQIGKAGPPGPGDRTDREVLKAMDDVYGVALDAARVGASAIMRLLDDGAVVVDSKGANVRDLVTNADHASEAAVMELIRSQRPEDAFLAEEAGEISGVSGVRWVIDPLDGTTNFAHGHTYYAVSVAAESAGEVIAAVVYQPVNEVWLGWGPRGPEGSECWGVTSCHDPAHALVSFAVPYDETRRRTAYRLLSRVAPRMHDLRNFGSTACDLLAVASGALDGFIGFAQLPWDIAAGLALVRAAGGVSRVLADVDGVDVVVAGNEKIVDAASAALLDRS
ncbi:MAG TPA: inositol monophosphatase family protein [Planosporangium sp.]|jgi:myo-inositol-1(or 4)-monophosphatase|nr:inositol monophosphatase family protein [Planosporangium sp.]